MSSEHSHRILRRIDVAFEVYCNTQCEPGKPLVAGRFLPAAFESFQCQGYWGNWRCVAGRRGTMIILQITRLRNGSLIAPVRGSVLA